MTGKIVGIAKDFVTGRYHLTLEMFENKDIEQLYDGLKNVEKLEITLKKYRKKRSLNANAYCWVLIDKIAKETLRTSDEVYEDMLRDYGYPMLNEDGTPVIITIKKGIESHVRELHIKLIKYGYLNGKEYGSYQVIRGSSEYNTKEMATFIDCVVYEAKELGIETLTPAELERMKREWIA